MDKLMSDKWCPPRLFKDDHSNLTQIDSITPLWNHLSSLDKMFTLLYKWCKWTAECWPEELALLGLYIHLWRRCFTNLCSPGCIKQLKLYLLSMYECFVLRMDKFLPQCVCGFEVNQEMMFIKGLPEFLRCFCIIEWWCCYVVCLLLSVHPGSFIGSDKGSVWVATGFRSSPDVLLFLILTLW